MDECPPKAGRDWKKTEKMSDYEIKEAIAAPGPAGITHKRKVRGREFFRRNLFCATEEKKKKNTDKSKLGK